MATIDGLTDFSVLSGKVLETPCVTHEKAPAVSGAVEGLAATIEVLAELALEMLELTSRSSEDSFTLKCLKIRSGEVGPKMAGDAAEKIVKEPSETFGPGDVVPKESKIATLEHGPVSKERERDPCALK